LATKKLADPVVHSKRGEGRTCNNDSCSGGWPHLGSSRGSRSSIIAQEDAKNVASGAVRAAEQAEAQGRPEQAHARRIVICGPNWTDYPGQKINHTTINRWVPLWSTNQTWDGKAALFAATKNRGKIDALGVGKAWPIGKWVAHLNGFAHLYTSNTPQSTSARLGGGEIGQGMEKWLRFVVCIFLEFCPAVFFNVIIKLRPGGRIRSLHPVASLNNVTINQRAAGCGLGQPREGAAAPFLRG
jgi:hypothetical protein